MVFITNVFLSLMIAINRIIRLLIEQNASIPGTNAFSLSIELHTLLGTKTKNKQTNKTRTHTTTNYKKNTPDIQIPKDCFPSCINSLQWTRYSHGWRLYSSSKNSHIHLVLVIQELASVIREQCYVFLLIFSSKHFKSHVSTKNIQRAHRITKNI